MGHVDNSQITPLYSNTTPGVTADATVFDPAIAAIIVSINENFDLFEAFKASVTLPIPDQSIVTNHLRNLAVTNPKLAPLAVTADKIADGTITTAKLADLVVTAAKIADGTITEAKMANSSVSRRMIRAGAVGANELDPSILTPVSESTINVALNQIKEHLTDLGVNVLFPPPPFVAGAGDGITNDKPILEALRDYILSNGGILYIPENANCYVSGDLDLFGLKNVRIEGIISGDGTSNILTLGYNSSQITATTYYVNNANNIKLRFAGLKNADAKINQCSYLQMFADGDVTVKNSLAYSRFSLGIISKFEFFSQGVQIGWINENVYIGGRISEFSMDGNYHHNNNRFIKPMFDSGILTVNKGGYNQLIGCRFEGTPTINFASGTSYNLMVISWYSNPGAFLLQNVVPSYVDNGVGNMVIPEHSSYHSYRKLFEINARTSNYNTSRFTRNAETITGLSFTNIWESDFIKINAPIGFQFLSDANLFRASIYFYNSAKTLITTQPTAIFAGIGYQWLTDHYINTTSVNNVKLAILPNPSDSSIVYVKIVIQQYAAGTFSEGILKVLEQKGRETNIVTPNKYLKWIGTSAPTAGSWEVGDIIYNSTPTAGGYIGWVCITTGSPGTWKGFGAIQA